MAMSGRSVGLIGPGKCSQRIGLHVVSGCDTVSYRFRKGKNSALKLLEIEISRLAQVFGQPGTTHDRLNASTDSLFLRVCAQKS